MAFEGPSGNVGGAVRDRYQRILQLAQDADEGRALPRSSGVARIDTSFMEEQDRRDAERQRLLMTPGVRRGGSTATRPQADSPLNVGSSVRFERFGDTYSYDPTAAADQVGSTEATKEAAADRTRYEALQKMPGFSPRQAARIVYGRGEMIDTDESRAALAAFVRRPSRESAAFAIERGASPYSVPFSAGFNPDAEPAARRGTQEYVDQQLQVFREEQSVREARTKREMELRDRLGDENRSGARPRTYRYTGEDKKVHVIDLDTGKEISESPTAVRTSSSRASGAGAAFMNGGAPAAPAAPADPAASFMSAPRDPRAERIAERTRELVPGMDFDDIRETAFQRLVNEGVEDPTSQQLRDMMNRISLARQQMRAGVEPRRP